MTISKKKAENPIEKPKSAVLKPKPKLEVETSRMWTSWQAEQRISLALSTYQTGKLFLIGLQETGRLSVFERNFERCMGLCAHDDYLYMSSLYQLWRLNNVVPAGKAVKGMDRVYMPMSSWVTGDLDIHDIVIDDRGRPVFVNTLFSCLATVSPDASFVPIWKPPFISRLAAEDRCHLNGLALRDGAPRYVTAVSQTDVHEGWRGHRRDGGVVMEVPSGEVICSGLSMPHSPRWYRGRLWLLDSGRGDFGYLDPSSGSFVPLAFCPGYARGLAFSGDFAIVGLSKPRDSKTFTGLELNERLESKKTAARCGILVIHLDTGDVVHSLTFEGIVEELYDVAVLSGVVRPGLIGFKTNEIRHTLVVGDSEPIPLPVVRH